MSNLAETLPDQPVQLQSAEVLAPQAGGWLVRSRDGKIATQLASSCLVQPETGDIVLIAIDACGRAQLYAIIERGSPDVRLSAPTNLIVKVAGRVQIISAQRLGLGSHRRLAVHAHQLTLQAAHAQVAITRLKHSAGRLTARLEALRAAGSSVELWALRVVQRVGRCWRTVSQLDWLLTGELNVRAERLMRWHGQVSTLQADDFVKIDGEQIHLR